jgi:hypothetical protein
VGCPAPFRPPLDPETSRWFATELQPHTGMLRAGLLSQFPDTSEVDDLVQDSSRLFLLNGATRMAWGARTIDWKINRDSNLSGAIAENEPGPEERSTTIRSSKSSAKRSKWNLRTAWVLNRKPRTKLPTRVTRGFRTQFNRRG